MPRLVLAGSLTLTLKSALALAPTDTLTRPMTGALVPQCISRTVTFALEALAVLLTTVPCSVPAPAPGLSELTLDTFMCGDASAGLAQTPSSPTTAIDAPTARPLRRFIR